MESNLNVYGARVHNLKDIDVSIPRNRLTVITGLSGSGKSSLAFDTIYAEGQRRYMETLSVYARQFLGGMERPDEAFDEREAVKELGIKADRVEVVFSGEDHFDIMDAWWLLTVKGMQSVVCMIGEIVNRSNLKLTGRELRLCG